MLCSERKKTPQKTEMMFYHQNKIYIKNKTKKNTKNYKRRTETAALKKSQYDQRETLNDNNRIDVACVDHSEINKYLHRMK